MRVLFAAGGTAGHVNPAIAMAQLLRSRIPECEFLFAVTPTGMEKHLIESEGYPTTELNVRGLKRKLSWDNLTSLRLLLTAERRADRCISDWDPQLVIGTGGYIAYPVIRAAQRKGIPNVLHESNAIAGLTVRLLAKKATGVLGGFPTVKESLPKKVNFYYVGTPVREEFRKISRGEARKHLGVRDGEFLITSVGGSLGSERLNATILETILILNQGRYNLKWLLGTGERFFPTTETRAKEYGLAAPQVTVLPYIKEMATVLRASDLVISRAGASTVTELSTIGTPAILIPYPAATADHQTKNARAYEQIGGCRTFEESSLSPSGLGACIRNLLDSPDALRKMRRCSSSLQPCDRDERIVRLLMEWARPSAH